MTKTLRLVWGSLLLALCAASFAEETRDYYAEPGIQAFKGFEGEFLNERIDTFGGTLQLGFTDLVVPGTGPDIRVTRTFTSHQAQMQYPQFMGMGWTMHYGRIVAPHRDRDKVCTQHGWNISTRDNPSLELPDGAREMLVLDDFSGAPDAYLITKSNWKVTCNLTDSGGFTVKSPDGTTYIMDKRFAGDQQTVAWYTSRITDKNGNSLEFTYEAIATANGPQNFPTTITASDGRVVTYVYLNNLLHQIKLGETVMATYEYAPAQGLDWSIQPQNLIQVTLPEGRVWNYTYNPKQLDAATGGPLPSSSQLAMLQYPTGAKVTYTYRPVIFDLTHAERVTFAIAGKSIYNADNVNTPKGSWTYSYAPESHYISANGSSMDVVTIDGPESRIKYYYYGVGYVRNSIDALWAVGLPYKREVYESGATVPVEEQVYGYDKRIVSNENFWHGGTEIDNYTWAALKTSEFTKRDGLAGGTVTYFENFDAFGNPQRVRQWGNSGTAPSWKVTTSVFQNDVVNWVLGLPTQVTVADDANNTPKVSTTEYDARFRPFRVTTAGVVTQTTYNEDGTVLTSVDPRNFTTTYGDYYRGQARRIVNPDLTEVTRVIDDLGRVTSITNEINKTRLFSYDGLGRLTDIIYPEGAPVHIAYGIRDKTLTRGFYQEQVDTDGWGRETTITRTDLQANTSIVITNEYSAEGKKTFTSYPNAGTGTRYQYDALGRLFEVRHPDDNTITTTYAGPEQTVTDEKGNVRVLLYHSYGGFDGGQLVNVEERNVTGDDPGIYDATVRLNVHGQPLSILQGILDADGYVTGKLRSYSYDSRFYPATEVNPETGTTTYTRDDAGNMLSKQVGSLPAITFRYDSRNRLEEVDYPDSASMSASGILAAADATYAYYADGNVHMASKGGVVREYQYTGNGNLDWEKLTVDGVAFTADYQYNALDYLSAMSYPSGRSLDYNPDALGRARQVGSLIPMVEYHPSGQIKTLTHANGVTTSIQLNDRKMVSALQTYGSQGDLINRAFDYDPTQNITAINDLVAPANSRQYQYDEIGRLRHAITPWGEMDYGYSRNDELRRIQVGAATTTLSYANGKLNRRGDRYYGFDAMGNMTSNQVVNAQFPSGVDQYDFVYDQSGSLRTATRAGWLTPKAWRYDVEGIRVLNETAGSPRAYYFHNKAGQLLGEYGSNAAFGKETVYLGSQAVATVKTNAPAIAVAGADVSLFSGEQVTLDGTASSDPEGRPLVLAWQQTAGPAATVTALSDGVIAVTGPSVSVETSLTFQLTATDEKSESGVDTVVLTVKPHQAPVANAGTGQTVMEGDVVTVSGTASTGQGSLTYAWSQLSGPAVTLKNASIATASFTAPFVTADADVVLRLTVTDSIGLTSSANVAVRTISASVDTDGDGLPDGWEIHHFGSIEAYSGEADPDGDGVTNAQEYADRINPLQAEPVPTAPAWGLAQSGSLSMGVAWAKVRGAAQYVIYWSTVPGVSTATANTIVVAGTAHYQRNLPTSTRYYYRVAARNNTGEGPVSAEFESGTGVRNWSTVSFSRGDDHAAANKYGSYAGVGYSCYSVYLNEDILSVNVYNAPLNRWYTVQFSVHDVGGWCDDFRIAINDNHVVSIAWNTTNGAIGYVVIPPEVYISGSAAGPIPYYTVPGGCLGCWGKDNGKAKIQVGKKGNFLLTQVNGRPKAVCLASTGAKEVALPYTAGTVKGLAVDAVDDGRFLTSWFEGDGDPLQASLPGRVVTALVDCGTATSTLLGSLAQTNTKWLTGATAAAGRVSVYWTNANVLYGRDYSQATAAWSSAYAIPRADGAVPQDFLVADAAAGGDVLVYKNTTSKGVVTYYANTRPAGGAWSATVFKPGVLIASAQALQTGEFLLLTSNSFSLKAPAGTWSAMTSRATTGVVNDVVQGIADNVTVLTGVSTFGLDRYRATYTPPDTTAPTTTSAITKYSSKGKNYADITLTVNESASTMFRISGAATVTAGGTTTTAWQTYTGKITVQLTGTATLEYYSRDAAGNTEAIKSGTL